MKKIEKVREELTSTTCPLCGERIVVGVERMYRETFVHRSCPHLSSSEYIDDYVVFTFGDDDGILMIGNNIFVNGVSHPIDFIDTEPDSLSEFGAEDYGRFSLPVFHTINGKWVDEKIKENGITLLKRRLEVDEISVREFFEKLRDTLATYSHLDTKKVFIIVSLPVLLNASGVIKEIGKEYVNIDIEAVGVIMATKRGVEKKAACLRYFSIAP